MSIKNLFDSRYALANKKRAKEIAISVFRLLFCICICYLFLYPILYMLITSFQSPSSIEDPTVIWIPKSLSLEGLKGAIKEMEYWRSAGLTLTITLGSTAAALCSCALAGYGLARFNFPGKIIVFVLLILTIVIPPQVLYSSTYILYRFFDFGGLLSIFGASINLLESPMVFILPSMFANGLRNGIFIFIFYSSFKGLPVEIEEAAKIDGCGVFKTFLRVMVPMAVPAFITVLLFSIVWHWTDYNSSATYFTQDLKPLVVMLKRLSTALYQGGYRDASGSVFSLRMYLQAGAMLTIAPPLILYIFTQKYFTESIERTGLVG